MPRAAKAARLWLRPARKLAAGAVVEPGRWFILDRGRQIGTGCIEGDVAGAERALARYTARKYAPARNERRLSEIPVCDVIAIYVLDRIPEQANPKKAIERAARLNEFFGAMTLDKITAETCREYAAHRAAETGSRKGGGARRDLQDLTAAINHHLSLGLHREIVKVTLPARGESRKRWLTREEVRALCRACAVTREIQNGQPTDKRPLAHLCRFVLFGAYTGSRPGALLGASWDRSIGRGWVDLDNGLFYRHADGARETAKRQPPVPLAPALWRLMRLWARQDGYSGPVVRFQDQPVQSVKTALKRATRLAGLGDAVTAYTLRHTCASWLAQRGVTSRKGAQFIGTTEAIFEKHYSHLAPDHLRTEAQALGRRRRKAS